METLKNKVAVVTGASKGIGAEIAKQFAYSGASVVVNYLSSQSQAEAVVKDIANAGGRAVAIKADVRKAKEVSLLFDEAEKAFGTIDVLVNNAGVYKFEPANMVSEFEFNRQFEANVLSVFLTSQEAMRRFNKGGESIINISSVASISATPMTLAYAASKSAVDSITKVLSKELGPRNIRVNSILPGPTHTDGNPVEGTDMADYIRANTPMGRVGKPLDSAKLALFLASDQSQWITGQMIAVSGGFD